MNSHFNHRIRANVPRFAKCRRSCSSKFGKVGRPGKFLASRFDPSNSRYFSFVNRSLKILGFTAFSAVILAENLGCASMVMNRYVTPKARGNLADGEFEKFNPDKVGPRVQKSVPEMDRYFARYAPLPTQESVDPKGGQGQ
jgi:hypothetical protein